MAKLWIRLGATLEASDDVIEKIKNGDEDALLSVLYGKSGTWMLDGESYLPSEVNDIPDGDMDFSLYNHIYCKRAKNVFARLGDTLMFFLRKVRRKLS